MKKQYLWLLPIAIILIIIAFYFLSSEQPVASIFQEQAETADTSGVTPAERASQNINEVETNTTGGAGGSEEGKGGSASPPKVNYTISVDSFPLNLEVLTNYSVNDVNLVVRENVPYSVQAESGTTACVLLTSGVKGGTVVTWLLDGEECVASLCSGFMGCGMYMNMSHTAFVYYTTPA